MNSWSPKVLKLQLSILPKGFLIPEKEESPAIEKPSEVSPEKLLKENTETFFLIQ